MKVNAEAAPAALTSDEARSGGPRAEDRAPDYSGAPGPGAVASLRADDFSRDVWCVFGLPIDVATVATAARAVEGAVREGRRLSFATPNVNILCAARRDPAIRRRFVDVDLSLADGAPVVALARYLGAPLTERCAGSDVFDALRKRPAIAGRRIRAFFLGGRDGAAEAARAAVNAERGGVEGVGALNPGFGDVEAMSGDDVVETINDAGADFVVVALGAAKGQAWISRNAARLDAAVVAHLGAAVDFAAGTVRRAPRSVARLGLEWAWRIYAEPALWRRYWRDARTLASLLARQAAPLAFVRLKRCGARAEALVSRTPAGVRVRLAGDLVRTDLAFVRQAFRAAAAADGDVELAFDGDGAMDAAFLGQVLMLERATSRRGARLVMRGLSKARARFARLSGVRHLVDDAPAPAIAGAAQTA
ncbi:MAG: WecB/TagA/CpsF family glycosyltransferase [Parvularculaceae bacterium]